MTQSSASGAPYPSDDVGPIDAWSEQVYFALKDWPVARAGGSWTRWEPGYLLLTITQAGGEEIEPVQLYSADGGLTATFGFWETDATDLYGPDEMDARSDANHAKGLVEQWLAGQLKTAVFFKADGQWCGSVSITLDEEEPQIREMAQRLWDFQPTSVEVRSPKRHEWRSLAIKPEWLIPPTPSPDRFPG